MNQERAYSRLRQELEPIINHSLAALVIEGSLAIIAALAYFLQKVLPHEKDLLSLVAKIDAWTALTVLCLFAVYTILQIALRLFRSLSEEWQKGSTTPAGLKRSTVND